MTMATSPDDNRLGRAYTATEVTVFYDRSRCRHYAECVRGLPQVFDPARRPWIRADLADADTVAEVVRRCPTGALHYRLLAEKPEEPPRPTIITPRAAPETRRRHPRSVEPGTWRLGISWTFRIARTARGAEDACVRGRA
jgi:uncharacterized Fe-S cluster protein YjdI